MHSAKETQVIAQPRASAFTAVAMNLTHSIAIVIARPLSPPAAGLPMSHSRVLKVELHFNFGVASPLVCVEHARPLVGGGSNYLQAGRTVSMMTDEVAHKAALAPLDREDRRAICLIRAMPAPFVSATPRRIRGVAMGLAFFPQRSGRVRQLPVPHPAAVRSGELLASCVEVAGGAGGPSAAQYSTLAQAAPSVRLWRRRAAEEPVSRVVAVSSQRSFHSVSCSNGRKLCSATLSTSHFVGRSAVRRTGSAGISTRLGVSVAPASADRLPRPAVRLSGSQS